MDVPLLRKMTEKSILTFGMYKGMTVDHVLRLGKMDYLRYIYYNVVGITFTDELLYKISVRGKWKIDKPGANPEAGVRLNNRMVEHRIKKGANTHPLWRAKVRGRSRYMDFRRRDAIKYSRSGMQWKNQGH
jgi:hypothetical protein